MRQVARVLLSGVVLALGCDGGGTLGGGNGATVDIRKHVVGLYDPCERRPELTGGAILDRRVDRVSGTLNLYGGDGTGVGSTALAIDLTWPARPVALCYESIAEGGLSVGPRVAIEGLTMRFVTADGTFDETLAAKAWLPTSGNTIIYPLVMAVTVRANLQGTWQPSPEYEGNTVDFVVHLGSAGSTSYDGTVGLGSGNPVELDAAIFGDRSMVGIWQSDPSP